MTNPFSNLYGQTFTAGLGQIAQQQTMPSYPTATTAYSWPQGVTMEPCYPVDYTLPLNIKLKDGTIKSVPWQEVMQALGIEW